MASQIMSQNTLDVATLKRCLFNGLTSKDFCAAVNSLIQSHEKPEQRIVDDVVQAKIGIYILARAFYDDPKDFSAIIASECGGRGGITALDQLLGYGEGAGRTGSLDTTNLPVIAQAIELASQIYRKSGKSGGGKKESERIGVPLLGEIPLAQEIMEASDSGIPLALQDNNSSASNLYSSLAEKIQTILGK